MAAPSPPPVQGFAAAGAAPAPRTPTSAAAAATAATWPGREALLVAAGVTGALGVGCGAFGFHGLPRLLRAWGKPAAEVERKLLEWRIAVQYNLLHSVAAVAALGLPDDAGRAPASAFLAGGAVFAGGIQGYVLTGSKLLQYATPIGGITMMAGWASLSAAHLRQLMERP